MSAVRMRLAFQYDFEISISLTISRAGFPGQNQNWVNPENRPTGEALEKYTVDLTALAKEGKLDPVIGRHHVSFPNFAFVCYLLYPQRSTLNEQFLMQLRILC